MAYPYEPDGGTFLIEVQHLTKRYGPVTAVDDVSFTVERGEILGFLGPNGAGKTTTMRVLTGYMPETPPLYPDMTVREYLTFVGRIKGVPRNERKARLDEMMQKTRIADVA